jgi:hypothetical protein
MMFGSIGYDLEWGPPKDPSCTKFGSYRQVVSEEKIKI